MRPRNFFSNVGMAYFFLVILSAVIEIVATLIIQQFAPHSFDRYPLVYWIVAMAPQYLVGMPVCVVVMRRLPAMTLHKNRTNARDWFSMLLISIFILEAGSIIGDVVSQLIGGLTGFEMSYNVEDLLSTGSLWYIFLFTVILGPILEELIFRRLLVNRLIVFGDRTAIVLSALIFGLVHGNFYQFFYAFGLGCLFAYVYIRTGKIRHTIMLHMSVNFLGSFVLTFFMERANLNQLMYNPTENAIRNALSNHPGAFIGIVLFELLLLVLAVIGLILFIRSFKKRTLYTGENAMPGWKTCGAFLGNLGVILFLAASAVMFAVGMIF